MKQFAIGTLTILPAMLTCSGCSDSAGSEQLADASRMPMTILVSQSSFESDTRLSYIDDVENLEEFYLALEVDDELYFEDYYSYSGDGLFSPVREDLTWPNDSRKEVSFYAMNLTFRNVEDSYAPCLPNRVPLPDNSVVVHKDSLDGDLVAAYVKTACTSTGAVELNFHHILAEVGLGIKGDYSQPDAAYNLLEVDVKGPDQAVYHFDRNGWSSYDGADQSEFTYFYMSNGLILTEGDEYVTVPRYLDSGERDLNMFLIPGVYNLSFTWVNQKLGTNTKNCDVELLAGRKNRINVTLPYTDNE